MRPKDALYTVYIRKFEVGRALILLFSKNRQISARFGLKVQEIAQN